MKVSAINNNLTKTTSPKNYRNNYSVAFTSNKAKKNDTDLDNFSKSSIGEKVATPFKWIGNKFSDGLKHLYLKPKKTKNEKIHIEEKVTDIKPSLSQNISKVDFPDPEFSSIDFKKIIADLKSDEPITKKWLKGNPLFLKVNDYNDFPNLKHEVNNNRSTYVKNIEVQFAKEKREYIRSIIKYVRHTDNRLVVKTLEAVEKYGSGIKDVEKIAGIAGEPSENQDVIRAFVRAIAANGTSKCSGFITDFVARTDGNIHEYEPKTVLTIMDSIAKIGTLKEIPKISEYLEHENESVINATQNAIKMIKKRGLDYE